MKQTSGNGKLSFALLQQANFAGSQCVLPSVKFFPPLPEPRLPLMQVTEGPHAGKLALLDFGLVAEIPVSDRQAMVSATIHLANRDWNGLINDFIDLQFLPPNSDRGLIIPVMDK